MDIDSINGGTIDTKGWLNPTVGTLRAKKIICSDIEDGGASTTVSAQDFQTVSPNADTLFLPMGGAISCRSTANFSTTINSTTFTQVSATSADKNFIFPNNLVVGSMYEYYISGQFINPASTSGALTFWPAFTNTTPTGAFPGTFMNSFIVPFDAKGPPATPTAFELRITFRVSAFTDTTVTCESMYTSIAEGPNASYPRVERGYDPQPANTPARSNNIVIPFIVYAQGGDNFSFTRTISYLRQIC
jgi:hypothetical protein